MQTNYAIVLAETIICETRHDRPSKWADYDDMLAGCKRPKEKNEKRMSYHRDTMKRIAVYIGVMMVNWQDVADTIYAPYHIG
jgi:hypothetical protein